MTSGLNGSEKCVMDDYWNTIMNMDQILANPEHNYIVVERAYSKPKMVNQSVPIEDERGAFVFYLGKANILREAFLTGGISPENMPNGAPKYICELATQ